MHKPPQCTSLMKHYCKSAIILVKMSKNPPLVSVIIPTRNSNRTIETCLKSIKKQTYKNLEVIVVDNFSSDETSIKARRLTNKVFQKGPERSAQRNYGAKKSSGKYIVWIDADMVLAPTVIEECVKEILKNHGLKALIIPEVSIGEGFWAACKTLEKRCYIEDEKIEGLRFIEKDTFFKVGGLSENFIAGEDWDFTSRVREYGYKIGRIKSVVYHHEGRLDLLTNLKKKYYYATKSLPYINRHIKGIADIILFIFRPAFFRNWRLLVADPIHTLGLIFMKFSEFGVGLLGIIVAKLKK